MEAQLRTATKDLETQHFTESKSEVLTALEETYNAMAKFIEETNSEKVQSLNTLNKIEKLIDINVRKVYSNLNVLEIQIRSRNLNRRIIFRKCEDRRALIFWK